MSKFCDIEIKDAGDWNKVANPKQLKSAMYKALGSGATVPKAGVRSALPANLKKFSKILKHKRAKRTRLPMVEVGFFGRAMYYINRRGVKWDAFTILYWANYGTLDKRDTDHHFTQKRKRVSASWRGGIAADHFWERGIAGTEDAALDKTTERLDKETDKLLTANGWR